MRKRTKLAIAPFILLAILFAILHARPVQKWISTTSMEFIRHAAGIDVNWEDFRFKLLTPKLEVDGIFIQGLGSISTITLSTGWSFWSISAEVDGMNIRILAGEKKEETDFSLNLPPFFHLHRLKVTNSHLMVKERSVPLQLEAFGITIADNHLSITDIQWEVGNYGPLNSSIDCLFTGEEKVLLIQNILIQNPKAQIEAAANIYSDPFRVVLTYTVEGDIAMYADHFRLGLPLDGEAEVQGKLTLSGDLFHLDASISSKELYFYGHSMGELNGLFRLDKKGDVKELALQAAVSEADVNLEMDLRRPNRAHLLITAPSISTSRIFQVMNLPEINVPQKVDAGMDYRWEGKVPAEGSGTLKAGGPDAPLQFEGSLHGFHAIEGKLVLRTEEGNLRLNGFIPFDSSTSIEVAGRAEKMKVGEVFSIIRPHLAEVPLLTGTFTGEFSVVQTWKSPLLSFSGSAAGVQYDTIEIGDGSVELAVHEAGVTIEKSLFQKEGGELRVYGTIPFGERQFSLSMESELFPFPAPVSLFLTSQGGISDESGNMVYSGHLSGAVVEGVTLEDLWAEATYREDRLDVEINRFNLLEGEGCGVLNYGDETLAISVSMENMELPGTPFDTSFSVSTIFKGESTTIAGGGRINGDLNHVLPASYKFLLNDSKGTCDLTFSNGGGIRGSADVSDLPILSINGSLSGIAPELLSGYTPFVYRLPLGASFDLSFPINDPLSVHGEIEVSPTGIDYNNQPFDLPEGLHAKIGDHKIEIARVPLDHPYGLLEISGEGELAPEYAFSVKLEGYFGDEIIQTLIPESSFFGDGYMDLSFGWRNGRFATDGVVEMSGRYFRYPTLAIYAKDVDLAVEFSGRRVSVKRARANLGEGSISLNGYILAGKTLTPQNLTLSVKGERVPLEFINGLDATADLDLKLITVEDKRQLMGEVKILDALYTKEFLIFSEIRRKILKRRVYRTSRKMPGVNLNIRVKAQDTIEIKNQMLKVRGGGELTITGTPDDPSVFGRISLLEGGIFEFNGIKYEVINATADFNDPININPYFNVTVGTDLRNYLIQVQMSGKSDYLNTQFSSQPYLPKSDILELLFGSMQSGGQGFIGGFFAEEISHELSEQASLLFGLTRVRIEPILDSETTSTARVSVSKQLNKNCLFTYTYTPSSNQQDLMSVECSVGHGTFVNAFREPDGSYYFEIHRRIKF